MILGIHYKSFKNIFIIAKTFILRKNFIWFKKYQTVFGWVKLAKYILAPGLTFIPVQYDIISKIICYEKMWKGWGLCFYYTAVDNLSQPQQYNLGCNIKQKTFHLKMKLLFIRLGRARGKNEKCVQSILKYKTNLMTNI